MDTYQVIAPAGRRVPVLLSVPHCGTGFPDEIKHEYDPELVDSPDDTDWYVDRLYNFASSMGITMIRAVLSRWVIDLNRHPENKPLYSDGRIITSLCPVTTFLNRPLYRDARTHVDSDEVRRRTEAYFNPYHNKVTDLLSDLKAEFGSVLLWDCHSIRQVVPTIQEEKFPDLILGSVDGASAHRRLIQTALAALRTTDYVVRHNRPFKGGYITRSYGRPIEDQHALQLEMTKINYMDDSENTYHRERSERMGQLLNRTLGQLASCILSLKDH